MNMLNKYAGIIALVAIVIAIGAFVVKTGSLTFGGATTYDEVDATALKIGGSNGSRLGPIMAGTCSLISNNFTLAASSSVAADCAVTGVVSGDYVFAAFATSSPNGAGWAIKQESASSTSGFITLRIVNETGASAIIPASIASSTDYLVLHPRSTVPGL